MATRKYIIQLTVRMARAASLIFALAPLLIAESGAATFSSANPKLSVGKTGAGGGLVESQPAGISCGSVCAARFKVNTYISLMAKPASGSVFTGWSGVCSGTSPTFAGVITSSVSCTANFALLAAAPPVTLWISPAGTGAGVVVSNPAGISCGSTCSANYAPGTVLALSATANAGSTFSSWSGACAGTSTNTSVTLSANATCFATFTASPVTAGTQIVTSSAGLNGNISPAAAQTVAHGASVVFSVTPASGYLASVGGTCGGTLVAATYTTNPVIADCSVVASFTAVPISVTGKSIFVAINGSDANSCVAAQSGTTPKQTIQAGLACLAAGDTLTLRDGTYLGAANALTNLPNGAAGSPITIQAENEGNVILAAGLSMSNTDAYLVFQGLRFQDSIGRTILGNHLKFFRNEFKGGCPSGNCAATTVGSNDVNDTADILFEDNWFHGRGGRYNLLVYNANRVVVRRGVIRHDAGWTDTKGDPEAGLNYYNSSNCSAQNVLILDNDLPYVSWQGAFYPLV